MESTPSSLPTSANWAASPPDLAGPDWERLRNCVAEPVRELIAVEVDTAARAQDIIAAMRAPTPARPGAVIEFDPVKLDPSDLLKQARAAATGWPSEAGLLCLVDTSRPQPGPDDAAAHAFWQGMNQLRENWDALDCQTLFFLLPYHYRFLSTAADHLKRWMAVKVHLRTAAVPDQPEHAIATLGIQDAPEALARLNVLEGQLREALSRGEPEASLVRRYYLPMFSDAVSCGDLARAHRLHNKIKTAKLDETDQAGWFNVNFHYQLDQLRVVAAKVIAEEHLQWSASHRLPREEAIAAFNLGRIAEEQRDFVAAERRYRQSLAIAEEHGDKKGAACIYHQLGRIAEEQRDFVTAERWYRQSLDVAEKHGDEHGVAITYHQLGRIAQQQRDLPAAECWYRKALGINEKFGDEHGAALTYHQLGRIAEERLDFLAAEHCYSKSLAIKDRQGNEHGAASTYHQLGRIAQQQRDFATAESHYRKSLGINEKLGDEHGAALTCGQLGLLAEVMGQPLAAGEKLLRAFTTFARLQDVHHTQGTLSNLSRLLRSAGPAEAAALREMGLKALGPEQMQVIEQALATQPKSGTESRLEPVAQAEGESGSAVPAG